MLKSGVGLRLISKTIEVSVSMAVSHEIKYNTTRDTYKHIKAKILMQEVRSYPTSPHTFNKTIH